MKALVDIAKEQGMTTQAIHKRARKYRDQLKGNMSVDQRGRKVVNGVGERIILTGLVGAAKDDVVEADAAEIDVVETDDRENSPKENDDLKRQVCDGTCMCPDKAYLQAALVEKDKQIKDLLINLGNLSTILDYEIKKNKVLLDYAVIEPKVKPVLPELPELSKERPNPVIKNKTIKQYFMSLLS